jgi:hypothetical protein
VGIDHVIRHGPGAAVNNENGIGHSNSPGLRAASSELLGTG